MNTLPTKMPPVLPTGYNSYESQQDLFIILMKNKETAEI